MSEIVLEPSSLAPESQESTGSPATLAANALNTSVNESSGETSAPQSWTENRAVCGQLKGEGKCYNASDCGSKNVGPVVSFGSSASRCLKVRLAVMDKKAVSVSSPCVQGALEGSSSADEQGRRVLRDGSRQRRKGWRQRLFWGKPLRSHLRGLESIVGIGAKTQESATWERSDKMDEEHLPPRSSRSRPMSKQELPGTLPPNFTEEGCASLKRPGWRGRTATRRLAGRIISQQRTRPARPT